MSEFQKILLKLDSTFTSKQMKILFNFIDRDESGTIEFDELNAYYCKANGLSQIMDLPPEHYYAKSKITHKIS